MRGNENRLDVDCDAEVGASAGLAPVEQEHTAVGSQRGGERAFGIEIEDVWRVDQRRDEDQRRSGAAMVAQTGATDGGHRWRLRRSGKTRRIGISFEAREGLGGKRGVARALLSHERQKQWQRPRRMGNAALMLHCSSPMLRCNRARCYEAFRIRSAVHG